MESVRETQPAPVPPLDLAPPPPGTKGAPRASSRLVSIDALRGAAIAGMILVNNPGAGPPMVYPALLHSQWDGWTFADIIFPAFLLLVGASMAFAFAPYLDGRKRLPTAYLRILRRVCLLFALGLVLNAFPHFGTGHLRIMGVLQRIALAYALASTIVLHARIRTQVMIATAILLGYWAAISWIRVPGVGAGPLTPAGNLPGYIDRRVFGAAHLYHGGPNDPEGLLGIIPSSATVLIGYWAGRWMRMPHDRLIRAMGLLIGGTTGLALGEVWSLALPINKRLWTPSYVVFMAGWVLLALALCHAALDWDRWWSRAPARPLQILGANAIVVYVGSELTGAALTNARHGRLGGHPQALSAWIWQHELVPVFGGLLGALVYAALILAAWWLVAAVLWRARWFVKV
ncbi:MAG: acyltransferase family protein [Acidimicrobiales bacterium]